MDEIEEEKIHDHHYTKHPGSEVLLTLDLENVGSAVPGDNG